MQDTQSNTLTHLSGYATLALVMAAADWSGLLAWVVALPLAAGTGYLLARRAYRHLLDHAAATVDTTTAPDTPADSPGPEPTATDGGVEA